MVTDSYLAKRYTGWLMEINVLLSGCQTLKWGGFLRFILFCLICLYNKGAFLVSHDIQEHTKIYDGCRNDCTYMS